MEPRPLERQKLAKQAGFLRQTLHSDRLEGVLKIPESLKNRMLEVILLPADDSATDRGARNTEMFSLEKFSGAWAGDPLVREDQGTYEAREELK